MTPHAHRAGVVRAVTAVATAMLPTLAVGEPVDAAGCAALAELVHRGPGAAREGDGTEPDDADEATPSTVGMGERA